MLESRQPRGKVASGTAVEHSSERGRRSGEDRGGESHPIDFAFLRRFTLGDVGVERQVLELFCTHAPALVADLKAASSEKAWRIAAHSLKGSALSLGAWAVARGAEQAEAASPFHGEAGDIVKRLERAVEEVRAHVAHLRPDP